MGDSGPEPPTDEVADAAAAAAAADAAAAEAAAEQEAAATKIQAISRGRASKYNARKNVERHRKREEDERAALKAREDRVELDLQERFGAIALQSAYRGFQGRQRMRLKREGGRALRQVDILGGLHTLGKSPHTRSHAYLGFSRVNKMINDIAVLHTFPFITDVDLTSNVRWAPPPPHHAPHHPTIHHHPTHRYSARSSPSRTFGTCAGWSRRRTSCRSRSTLRPARHGHTTPATCSWALAW